MKSNILIIILSLLLVFGSFGFSVNINNCQEINSGGEYVLTTNLTNESTCIRITASNVILDGAGYWINRTGGSEDAYGIYVYNVENVTIKNVNVANWTYGIYLNSLSNITLINNTANSNGEVGIYLYSSSNNILTNNNINSNNAGIYLCFSSNNTLINNTANSNSLFGIYLYSSSNNILTNNTANSNSLYGIYLYFSSNNNTLTNNNANSNRYYGIILFSSSNNILTNNTMNNNKYNFGIAGESISHYYQDIDTSNTVDGKPIYYWTNKKYGPNNCKDAEINESTNAGFVALISCDNITVKNLNLIYNSKGILLVNTTNSKISNNNINSNWRGIYLDSSSNNTLTNNIASTNNDTGIYLRSSSNNNIYNNFFNNTNNFYFQGTAYLNTWNTTKAPGTNIVGGNYLGGNFWAKPDGTGFSENITECNPGEDGICKNAYQLNSNNIDYHPLTLINLKVSDLTFTPSNPYTSDNVIISAKILSNSISGNIKIQVYDNNNLIYTISPYSVSPGENSLTINLGYLTSGTHTIKLVIDPDNAYPEVNENDNEISTEIYVISRFIPSSSTYYSSSSDSSISAGTNKISSGQSITY
ncbi:MAG: NosD domain-containing protein, partial [Candidatus Aenigmatarchaeota archaeon]